MTYDIFHRTLYEYPEPVTVSHHAARLEPRSLPNQQCELFSLQIEPAPARRNLRVDYFGNQVCGFSVQEIHERLEITANSRVTVSNRPFTYALTVCEPSGARLVSVRAPAAPYTVCD